MGKYSTGTYRSLSGDFQVHFYMNRAGAVNYDFDYKAVFNKAIGGLAGEGSLC